MATVVGRDNAFVKKNNQIINTFSHAIGLNSLRCVYRRLGYQIGDETALTIGRVLHQGEEGCQSIQLVH